MTDASAPAADILGDYTLPDDQRDHVLALRGLLAFGLLRHSLQKRHLVDYGVNRWVGGERERERERERELKAVLWCAQHD